MIRDEINDMEIASPSVVSKAARDFAAALVETPQFKAFEQASAALRTASEAAVCRASASCTAELIPLR